MESEGSLPCSRQPATVIPILSRMNPVYEFPTCSSEINFNIILSLFQNSVKFCGSFRNRLAFYFEESLAPHPICNLEDHPLSAVRNCLFNTFAGTHTTRNITDNCREISQRMNQVTGFLVPYIGF